MKTKQNKTKKTIAVLGPAGSYSEQAAFQYDKNCKPEYFDTISEIIDELSTGIIDMAILPMENSVQGTVLETLDGIYYNNLKIFDETVLDIRHSIAGLSDLVARGNRKGVANKEEIADNIRFIYSHPQSLGQCAKYLKKNFPKAKLIPITSNSAAFKKIKEEKLIDALAVGPKICADIYGLSIVEEGIQDVSNNQTLFVVVSGSKTSQKSKLGHVLMVLAPGKDRPGLLFDMLHAFKKKNINLLKLESRPSRNKLGSYIFYVKAEVTGRDKKLAEIINELKEIGLVTVLTN